MSTQCSTSCIARVPIYSRCRLANGRSPRCIRYATTRMQMCKSIRSRRKESKRHLQKVMDKTKEIWTGIMFVVGVSPETKTRQTRTVG
ncbi:hypothetical protein KVT40_005690 [Elsinoe batatas]|uniref:Uncharacterized protein n=1 Tax=Elsinoe batatas TaxID=2601811 RepID=A0A8K0PCC3_9PEZI|nr:hypothetical protein KVT40_005690 [Elsinoe batatas]